MDDYKSLAHTKWKCQYHVVFIPKYRRKVLYGKLRTSLGTVFHELARHKGSTIERGVCCPDHGHMLIWIPPKFAVSSVVGYVKGKVPSMWLGIFWARPGIIPDNPCGPEDFL